MAEILEYLLKDLNCSLCFSSLVLFPFCVVSGLKDNPDEDITPRVIMIGGKVCALPLFFVTANL